MSYSEAAELHLLSLLEALKEDDHGIRTGLITLNFEDPEYSHSSCHFLRRDAEQTAKKSLAGKGRKRELRNREARFAAWSARSFPAMPK